MKIIDVFLFYNELDLARIRINELKDYVDLFVVVEGSCTHSGNEKPYYFDQLESEFKDLPIRRVKTLLTRREVPMDNEEVQRNSMLEGIKDADATDIILMSDCDEIPRATELLTPAPGNFAVFKQIMSYFYINNIDTSEWCGTVRAEAQVLYQQGRTPQDLRNLSVFCSLPQIPNGGWHISYTGGVQGVITKLENFSHSDRLNKPPFNDPTYIQARLDRGGDLFDRQSGFGIVPLDDRFPKYLLDNVDKFPGLVYNVPV